MVASSSDLREHARRHRTVTAGRLVALALVSLVLGTAGREVVDVGAWGPLGVAAGALLAVHLGSLVAVRVPALQRPAAELALLVEVAAIAVVLAVTGGSASPFAPLLLLEVVAVTLAYGRWAGLRATLLATLATGWLWSLDRAADLAPTTATLQAGLLVGAVVATAVTTAWLSAVVERDLRRRTEDLALLHDVTPDLDPRLGPQRIADVLARIVRDRLGYQQAAIWTRTSGGFTALAVAGQEIAVQAPRGWDLPGDAPPLPEVLDAEGVHPLPRHVERPDALRSAFGDGAPLVLVPLRVDDRAIGLLAAEVPPRRFGRPPVVRRQDARLLRMLADQAALLLDNARLQADLADLAVTDAITGLPNHRFLQQRLQEELDRASRRAARDDARDLSFALFDLDHFKAVNDTYGHPAGDRVLAAVAAAAERGLRGADVVCRYGGEEFAVVLVDASADAAVQACERLRRAIAELRLEAIDGRPIPPVTASFGVATVRDVVPSAEELVAAADTALYAAKAAGRDQVCHADGRAQTPELHR
ncbi:sensor domain-containing diguanylate cyclase [Nitriliruptoraceae bacterium ZYF776]|nr:sensor domain-containing diguanylate cyclase [Profundirhabdus halotolerans]